MLRFLRKPLSVLLGLLHFVGSNSWLIAVVGVPLTIMSGRYVALLYLVGLILFWELVRRSIEKIARRRGASRALPHYAFTSNGARLLAIAFLLCAVSIHTGLNFVYLTTSLVIALLVCSMLGCAVTMSGILAEWDLPEHVFAGQSFTASLVVRNTRLLLSSLALTVNGDLRGDEDAKEKSRYVDSLAPRTSRSVPYEHTVERRGEHSLQPFELATRFPLGLVEARVPLQRDRHLLVLPRLGTINRSSLLRHGLLPEQWGERLWRKSAAGDFRSLREYRAGDSLAHIHWKTSARMGDLYVREFESPPVHHVLVLLDAFVPAAQGPESPPRLETFEKAVSFAATLAQFFLEDGIFFAFASFCPNLVRVPYDVGPGHFYQVLECLALAQPSSEHTMDDLLAALDVKEFAMGKICAISLGAARTSLHSNRLRALGGNVLHVHAGSREFDDIFTVDT